MFIINKLFKRLFILIVIIIFLIAFSSSYNSLYITNLDYVVAIGFDTSSSNKYKISFQFAKPSAVSESGTTEATPTIINSVEASSLSNAITLMNAYVGKEINLSHCKAIVFSEELAMQGISENIYTLMNNTQIRPSAYIIVSKCDAEFYIESSQPLFENLITEYYETFPNSSQYTGYVANTTISDFFSSMSSKTSEPTAILGGLNTEESSKNSSSNSRKWF